MYPNVASLWNEFFIKMKTVGTKDSIKAEFNSFSCFSVHLLVNIVCVDYVYVNFVVYFCVYINTGVKYLLT